MQPYFMLERRIQSQARAHVEDEARSLSAIPGLSGGVQPLRLGRRVRQVLFVPVPAWLDVIHTCNWVARGGVLPVIFHVTNVQSKSHRMRHF